MGKVAAVFMFEWRRAFSAPRLAWWAVLTLFPAFIVTLIRVSPIQTIPREAWAVFLFALVPMLVTMLGSFLWMTPAVSAELERRSWVYLAVRPNGPATVLLGKFLTACTWVLPATLCGLTLAVGIAQTGDAWRLWTAIAKLACIACPAYAAIYLMLGVLIPKRAMVIAVAYTLIFELIIAFVPAMINKLSIQYRLRALLLNWADIKIGDSREFETMAFVDNSPPWHHVTVLIVYTLTLLLVSTALIRFREFKTADESDT
jgi:ABC-type transport system involved in multi-copper enzyme maturation permease subunit